MPAYRVVAFLEELPPPLGLPDPRDVEPTRRGAAQRQSMIGGGVSSSKQSHEWAYRLSHRQRVSPSLSARRRRVDSSPRRRFTIEFVRNMRIKVAATASSPIFCRVRAVYHPSAGGVPT